MKYKKYCDICYKKKYCKSDLRQYNCPYFFPKDGDWEAYLEKAKNPALLIKDQQEGRAE